MKKIVLAMAFVFCFVSISFAEGTVYDSNNRNFTGTFYWTDYDVNNLTIISGQEYFQGTLIAALKDMGWPPLYTGFKGSTGDGKLDIDIAYGDSESIIFQTHNLSGDSHWYWQGLNIYSPSSDYFTENLSYSYHHQFNSYEISPGVWRVVVIELNIDAAAAPVPEPATMLMLGLGLAGAAVARRKICK